MYLNMIHTPGSVGCFDCRDVPLLRPPVGADRSYARISTQIMPLRRRLLLYLYAQI